MVKSKVKIHRIKEALKNHSGKFVFPVAERRRERLLKDEDFDAPEELPDLVDTSDDEGPPMGQPPTDNPADADELSAKAEVPPTGTDTR